MDISCIFFGFLFVISGAMFALGKVHIRLSAWKNMPDEEKRKINIYPLVRNIGGVIILCGIIFLLKGFIAGFSSKLFIGAMILWLILAGADVFYISKSKRYKNQ